MSEIQTLAKMKHANLMTISDVLKEKEESKLKFLLFMEYCEDDLRNFIKDQKFQDFEEKLQIMYEICQGIKYMHHSGKMHRDIKPANIFLKKINDKKWQVKIGDFGISKSIKNCRQKHQYIDRNTPIYVSRSFKE